MTISELSEKYYNELSSTMGDTELRYYLLSPLFNKLYQYKVIYHERFTALIQLSDIIITPKMFTAHADLISLIKQRSNSSSPVPKSWEVSASWGVLRLAKGCLIPYGAWLMWTDPSLVEKAEKLVLENKFDEAYNMTMGQF